MVDIPSEGIVQLLQVKPKYPDAEWIDVMGFVKGSDDWFTLSKIPSTHDEFIDGVIAKTTVGQARKRHISVGHYERGELSGFVSFGLDDPELPYEILSYIERTASQGKYAARLKEE